MCVLPIFRVFFRHLLIWPEVAVHMTLSKSIYLQPKVRYYFHADMRLMGAYEAMLNVGESTGGLRNEWGNIAVLDGRSRWKTCMDAVIVQLTLSKAS